MKKLFAGAALAASLVLGSGIAAAPVRAATTDAAPPALAPGAYTFETALSPVYYGAGAYVGILKLRVAPDGSLGGLFRYEDSGDFHWVVGGITNGHVWLDLGPGIPRIVNGRLEDGKIVAGTYFSGQRYEFVATQSASPRL